MEITLTKKAFLNIIGGIEEIYKMAKPEEKLSNSTYKTRGEKTQENPHGWYDFVPDVNKPCIFMLPGDGTSGDYGANAQLKKIVELLKARGCEKEVDACVVVYDFGIKFYENKQEARNLLMNKYNRGSKKNTSSREQPESEIINPEYIDDIFEKFFENRVSDNDGERLSYNEACRRVRNLTIFAHCHGAYTFLKLEEKMQQRMKELGYSDAERQGIQKQMLCAAYAPYCPLGISKSTMLSFCCAKDTVVRHGNHFQDGIRYLNNNNRLQFSYFPKEKGEVFVAPSFMIDEMDGHNFIWHFPKRKEIFYDLKPSSQSNWIAENDPIKSSQALTGMLGNVLVNGAICAIEGTPLPDTKELVCQYREVGNDNELVNSQISSVFKMIYAIAKNNGETCWNVIHNMTHDTAKKKSEAKSKIKTLRKYAEPNLGKSKRNGVEKLSICTRLYFDKIKKKLR